jgi:hypothetical protein
MVAFFGRYASLPYEQEGVQFNIKNLVYGDFVESSEDVSDIVPNEEVESQEDSFNDNEGDE